jgi:hypothetical protein
MSENDKCPVCGWPVAFKGMTEINYQCGCQMYLRISDATWHKRCGCGNAHDIAIALRAQLQAADEQRDALLAAARARILELEAQLRKALEAANNG